MFIRIFLSRHLQGAAPRDGQTCPDIVWFLYLFCDDEKEEDGSATNDVLLALDHQLSLEPSKVLSYRILFCFASDLRLCCRHL